MNCYECDDLGLIAYLPTDSPKTVDTATAADMNYLVCLCEVGQKFRVDTNNGRKTNPQWHLWAATNHVALDRVALVEDVYDAAELKAAGLTVQAPTADREASMLAAGKKAKR